MSDETRDAVAHAATPGAALAAAGPETDASGEAETSAGRGLQGPSGAGPGRAGETEAASNRERPPEVQTAADSGGAGQTEAASDPGSGAGPADPEPGGASVARRRRGAALEHSILEAAWKELAEVGYAHVTMEGVAARARTGKQVLYRRWSGRAELVLAAVRHHTGSILDGIPDTGELRGDTLAVLHRMVERQREIGSDAFHGLMAELPALGGREFALLGGVMSEIVRRAAARGEIGPGPVSARVAAVPLELLRYQMLVSADQSVGEQVLRELVDEIFLPLVHVHADAAAPPAEPAPGTRR